MLYLCIVLWHPSFILTQSWHFLLTHWARVTHLCVSNQTSLVQIMVCRLVSPCGCGDLSVRLGSRISPHRHRVVVEVHWRGAQGWRSISWVVATFNHVGGSFNLSMAATGDVWKIPFFEFGVMCCMLSTFHVSSRIVANFSEPPLLFSQQLFRPCWRKTLPENYYPYL